MERNVNRPPVEITTVMVLSPVVRLSTMELAKTVIFASGLTMSKVVSSLKVTSLAARVGVRGKARRAIKIIIQYLFFIEKLVFVSHVKPVR